MAYLMPLFGTGDHLLVFVPSFFFFATFDILKVKLLSNPENDKNERPWNFGTPENLSK